MFGQSESDKGQKLTNVVSAGHDVHRAYVDKAAGKGSLCALKAIVSSLVVKSWQNAFALAYAVRWRQLASAHT